MPYYTNVGMGTSEAKTKAVGRVHNTALEDSQP